MNANQYLNAALRTESTPEMFGPTERARMLARLLHAAIGMCTESGELQDALKKQLIYGKELDAVNVVEEIGDQLWYIAIALDAVGSTFEEAFDKNIAKLRARFPEKFTQERALNRNLPAERVALEGTDDGTPG